MNSLDSFSWGRKIKRTSKISSAALGSLARILLENYGGFKPSRSAHALALKEVLGDVKGPLMKLAQWLSTVPGALPPEYTEVLMTLQNQAPPMGWLFVKRRMVQELGPQWPSLFRTFDPHPTAAASLGQVHKAVDLQGRSLACKLQYPDMASTVTQDLQHLKGFLGIYEKVSDALKTQDIFHEISERLQEELDYIQEARHMRFYHTALKGVENVFVPQEVASLCTKRLLTMTWLEGRSLLDFKNHCQDLRNTLAQRLFHLWYQPFYTYGLLHGDPHLGNYTVTQDLGINLLDFGCVRVFPGTFIHSVLELYYGLRDHDQERLAEAYKAWGFAPLTRELLEVLTVWAQFLYDPLLEDKPRLIHAHHQGRNGSHIAREVHQALHRIGGVRPPREFVLMDRAAVGMGAAFMHLDAVVNWHQAYENLIQGFSVESLRKNQLTLGIMT